ncbi:Fe-Mn family superoxide dismutase [Pelotomaculum propionicicum]|uniref:Fe-Mn family superoxide dismutase n=1 Tax=Pelotomaculum propionicicum TaxID=258475 RepID=UPI003B799F75
MEKEISHEIHCGFSKELLEEHYARYPAVHENKIKEIEARLLKADTVLANTTYCPLRSLKMEHTHALNSVKLHKCFFKNITQGAATQPSLEMLGMLERVFGSPQEWEKQFFALAMCARGWVVLGFDLEDGTLRNYFSDSHAEGVWSVFPLLVLDVFEHAYCTAFPSRSDYVREFLRRVDWAEVSRRLHAAMNMYKSK